MGQSLGGFVVLALIVGAIYFADWLLDRTSSRFAAKRKAARNVVESERIRAYDKANWHMESVREADLPGDRAFNHTTFFFSWLVLKRLTSHSLEKARANELAGFRAGRISINDIYAGLDACLISSMLNEEGNAFASEYFDFQKGAWMADLEAALPGATSYGVQYTSGKEALAHAVISRRFAEWQSSRQELPN